MEKHEDNLDKLLKAELEKEAGEIMEEVDSDEHAGHFLSRRPG